MEFSWCIWILALVGCPSSKADNTISRKNSTNTHYFEAPSTHFTVPLNSQISAEEDSQRKSSFRTHIELKKYFVDKTAFIADVIYYNGDVIAISRPRGSGKTMNLDMLADFCSVHTNSNDLFKSSWIIMQNKYEPLRKLYMNQIPVIFLNLKTVGEQKTYKTAENEFWKLVKLLYKQFSYLLDSNVLSDFRKSQYREVVKSKEYVNSAIKTLCELLCGHHGKRPLLIIDEADAPLAGAVYYGYFRNMSSHLVRFFSTNLKGNFGSFIKAVILGDTPDFDSYFPSNVNPAFTIFDTEFDSSFGFVRTEVETLLAESNKLDLLPKISRWYSNFRVGGHDIFNPRSVIECRENNWSVEKYATKTALTKLTTRLFNEFGLLAPMHIQLLIANETLQKKTDLNLRLEDVLTYEYAIWSYLLHCGIITAKEKPTSDYHGKITFQLPAYDVRRMLQDDIIKPLVDIHKIPSYECFIEAIDSGDHKYVTDALKMYIEDAGIFLKSIVHTKAQEEGRLQEYIEVIVQKWLTKGEVRKQHVVINKYGVFIAFKGHSKKAPWVIFIKKPGNFSAPKPAIETPQVRGFIFTDFIIDELPLLSFKQFVVYIVTLPLKDMWQQTDLCIMMSAALQEWVHKIPGMSQFFIPN